jgi:ABC-type taurine transport system ATPase subunit
MSTRKIFLASIVTAVGLSVVGCSGGGGSSILELLAHLMEY